MPTHGKTSSAWQPAAPCMHGLRHAVCIPLHASLRSVSESEFADRNGAPACVSGFSRQPSASATAWSWRHPWRRNIHARQSSSAVSHTGAVTTPKAPTCAVLQQQRRQDMHGSMSDGCNWRHVALQRVMTQTTSNSKRNCLDSAVCHTGMYRCSSAMQQWLAKSLLSVLSAELTRAYTIP